MANRLSITRRAVVRGSLGLIGSFVLGACAPAAQPSPTSPPKPAESAPKPTTAPAAPKPAESKPAAAAPTQAPAQKPAAQAQPAESWDQILAAAKREGRVSVIGPQNRLSEPPLTEEFQKRYPDIQVDYNPSPAPQIGPKLFNERAAGQYLVDLIVHGAVVTFPLLRPTNILDPVEPFLVGPDIQQPKWRDGKFSFADTDGKYIMFMSAYVGVAFAINKDQAAEGDFKAWKDLLDPKWKGKITMWDPRVTASAGQSVVQYMYSAKGLGKEFVTELLKQDVSLSRDDRQLLDSLSRGQYAIGIAVNDNQTDELIGKGLPLAQISTGDLQEQPMLRSGVGALAVVNRAPHPNALKVYLNYLLSQEGQLAWSKAISNASLRTDVPIDHVKAALLPKPGVDYLLLDQEVYKSGKLAEESDALVRSLLPQ